jgi:hypothetical protein
MPWMQPVFTDSNRASDGSLIRASSESIQYGNPAYRAMDGNKTATSDGYFWSTNNSTTGWWRVDFPYAIRLTKLTHYNCYNATYADITSRYYTDPSRSVPLGDAFSLSGSWTPLVVYDSAENPIRTRGIFFEKTDGSVWSGIGELELEATEMAYEAGEGR